MRGSGPTWWLKNKVIIELKSVERLQPVHSKQLLTYLRLMDFRLGILINFGENLLKDGIKRVVNSLPADPPFLNVSNKVFVP
jgi:hypothetical protein